jgi:hypothetical protein
MMIKKYGRISIFILALYVFILLGLITMLINHTFISIPLIVAFILVTIFTVSSITKIGNEIMATNDPITRILLKVLKKKKFRSIMGDIYCDKLKEKGLDV